VGSADDTHEMGGNYRYQAAKSRYGEHVAKFDEAFAAGRGLVLTAEQLGDDPAGAGASCFAADVEQLRLRTPHSAAEQAEDFALLIAQRGADR